MKRIRTGFAVALMALWLLLPLQGGGQVAAQSAGTLHHAALVIQFPNGSIETRCIAFTEPKISGYDALLRSGLDIVTAASSWGLAICSIGGQGCPARDCFCECHELGSGCYYWSYWHWKQGRWEYSQLGAASYWLSDGDVDGWIWNTGSDEPSVPDYAGICVPPTAAPSSTPSPLPATAQPTATARPPTAAAPTATTGSTAAAASSAASAHATPSPAATAPAATAGAAITARPTASRAAAAAAALAAKAQATATAIISAEASPSPAAPARDTQEQAATAIPSTADTPSSEAAAAESSGRAVAWPTITPTITVQGASQSNTISYLLFGLLALALIGLFIYLGSHGAHSQTGGRA